MVPTERTATAKRKRRRRRHKTRWNELYNTNSDVTGKNVDDPMVSAKWKRIVQIDSGDSR